MKRTWFPFLVIIALLGLLVLLAGLQYKWLGQISDAERVRLGERLGDDSQRFAEDFNREIQSVYFGFQVNARGFEEENWDGFYKRFLFWKTQTRYPGLIKDFYFIKKGAEPRLLRFDAENGSFNEAVWTVELETVKKKINSGVEYRPVSAEPLALAVPLYPGKEDDKQMIIRTTKLRAGAPGPEVELTRPEEYGFLVIQLDEQVIKDQIFPALVAKYFSGADGADYKISVAGENGEAVFQTHKEPLTDQDSSIKFFDLQPNEFVFFAERIDDSIINRELKEKKKVIYSETHTAADEEKILTVNVEGVEDAAAAPRELAREKNHTGGGIWTLNIQHTAGSLEQFIANTRNRNLAVSFGILSLLAVSIILIFISSQRARILARRQIDFVSSVSHEFRTPLAVIYSAGENLTDGVVSSEKQITRYGNLIKGEGKKLSAMVEQILEFAGARAGRRKYDFRQTPVADILEDALGECRPLIDEKDFVLEKDFAEELPVISADANALSHAIQNLLINAIKYSNGSRWLKITVRNGSGELLISVEDRGIGIAKKELPYIFEPFYRAKSVVDEQIHGNGLGLSLVKQIVEAHKGRIRVDSELGKGSKFTIELATEKV